MRCIDKNCSQNCQYAVLKKTTVKSFDGHTKKNQDAFNVYCNHPSLKEKRYVSFVIWVDEYLEPNFPCPLDMDKYNSNLISKIINWCKLLIHHN